MSVEACAGIVARADPDRFLAAMAAPVADRARLLPLYAFNVEVARAPYVSAEPMIGEMRLQWWRDAVAEVAAGQPPRAHEVAAPLAEVQREAGLPTALLDAMVAARRWDLFRDPFEDDAAFRAHLDATAGALLWASALALGADAALEAPVRRAGFAHGLALWLRAVPELEARGHKPLVDGRPGAIGRLAEEGLAALAEAHRTAMGAAVPALRATWLAGPLLAQAKREPGRVANGALGLSEARRRGRLLRLTLSGGW